jgi:glycosyltransferase involved in cell wall biosynthesis
LASLERQTCPYFEVIIVDQNKDDRLLPVIRRHPGLSILHLHSEPGLSRARNVGLRAARGDIVAIPDDDAWYPDHLVQQITDRFRSHPEFGILNTVKRNEKNELVGPRWPPTARRCRREDLLDCAISSALFFRRSVCQVVGGFNEQIGVGADSNYQSGEETDYVLRADRLGFQVWYEPSLTVHHPKLDSVERLKRVSYKFALGSGYVLRAHGFPPHVLARRLIRCVGGAVVSLLKFDIPRAETYLLRGAGLFRGYCFGPRDLAKLVKPADKAMAQSG